MGRRLLQYYESLLKRSPQATKGVMAGGLALVGDVLAQKLRPETGSSQAPSSTTTSSPSSTSTLTSTAATASSSSSSSSSSPSSSSSAGKPAPSSCLSSLDASRTVAFTVHGGLWAAFGLHPWFQLLERFFPGTSQASVLSKVAAHHSICNPFLYLPIFYLANGCLRGRSLDQILEKAQAEYWDTLCYIWKLWIPITIVQFALVPERHQVLFVAVANLGWNTFLSILYNVKS